MIEIDSSYKVDEDVISLNEEDDENLFRASNSFSKKELNSINAVSSRDDQKKVFLDD